ncbi:hypothetical protein B7P43_G13849 [Cryptotermes secundus]|uniref:Transcription factor IIIC 90kDa subunit N-terminal domain-containing protein n=1 Tax=Cryptotermes secundus TaxID=105785 RepID=A0A2J7QHF3_9NEOP|nr:hypothetical protein B7P43_G13849 [Cryptotermes secundus]
MELEEIHTLALSPAVAASFAALWSDDDKISVITEKGLHVMELVPDPDGAQQVLELRRSWVKPCDYFPTSETGIDYNSLIWKLDQQDAYRLILDTCLAPNLTTTKSVAPYITQVAWSPAGMLQYGRCLLASLTNYGCVLVHMPQSKQWSTMVDISSLWSKHCSENWGDDGDINGDISILQSRAEKLKATAITWGNIMSDGDRTYSYLMVGLLNGVIVVWQINAVTVRSRKCELQPKILLQFETKMYNITTLHWRVIDDQTGWLCAGDVRGIVKMLSLSKVQDKLQCMSSTEVWPHSDRIQVTKLLTLPCNVIENSPVTVVAIKGGFVVAVALDMDGTVVATWPYMVGNLSVTGVVLLDQHSLLVLTHSGSFNILRVVKTGVNLSLEAKVLSPIKIPKSAYYGITASANKAIFCLVTRYVRIDQFGS